MGGLNVNALCKKCEGGLNKGGIFPPGADPYNMCMGDNGNEVCWYHVLLHFLFTYNKISGDITYYHKECVPENLKAFLPTQEKIDKYLETDRAGEIVSIRISSDSANKTRLGPKN